MGEMIKRVSRAIDPSLWAAIDAGYAADEEIDQALEMGRRAIEAMREPTDAMVQAAWDDLSRPTPAERMSLELGCAQDAFKLKMRRRHRAMIDQALSEET